MRKSLSFAVAFMWSSSAIPAISEPIVTSLAINVRNDGPTTIFIYWDDSGRCGEKAGCSPFQGMDPRKNGLRIPKGFVKSFGGDKQSVQIGDSPTAHIFVAAKDTLPSKENASKTFSARDLQRDEKMIGVVNLVWSGTDLKVEKN